jgi:hypothetical protein
MLDDLIREVRADADRNGTPDILERGRQNTRSIDAVRHEPAQQPSANGVGGGPRDFR